MIVADCTLIVPMYVTDPRTPVAEAVLLRDPLWLSPPLWRSEMRNAIRAYFRASHITLDEAKLSMRRAEAHMSRGEVVVSSDAVLDIVGTFGCTAYDAEYVVVARELGLPLITADAELLRKFPDVAMTAESFAGGVT
ncbi:MAG: type II toxin-antitoxin system VapC family toxin [Gemmatimonadaceae bacterium]